MHKHNEKGITLILGTLSLLFIVPMMGLAIDVGFLYGVRSKMQAAVDGAALAAARALSIGQSLASQTSSAQNNAVTWFYANFPNNYFGTKNIQMGTSNVIVATDPNNPQLRDVTVSASAQVNTFFMKWLGFNATTVGALGTASRRTVVAMLVLDRSGSMCASGGTIHAPCLGTSSTYPCGNMVSAAKLFTGQFAEGSDYIGLISFSDNSYIHSVPVQNFQTTLGYSNSSGSSTGDLDKISCDGGTGTAEAMSMAYQIIEQMNLPGALNVIMLETDGLPNTLTMNFWDSTNKVPGLTKTGTSPSGCDDTSTKTYKSGGFGSSAAVPSWTPGLSLTASPFLTSSGPFSSIPKGMVGAVASSDPSSGNDFFLMINYWTTATGTGQSQGTSGDPYNSTSYVTSTNAKGCGFAGGQSTTTPNDIAWFPSTDVFSNSLNPSAYSYQSVTTDGQGHITQNGWANFHSAVLNATDNSAYQARTNANIPVAVFAIGLGGNSTNGPPDPVLLQRMANDPNGDRYNSTGPDNGGYYWPCTQESGCTTWSSQPQGVFVYSPSATNLGNAFLSIASQVLRLSK